MQSMTQLRVRGSVRVAHLYRRYLDEVIDNSLEPETVRHKVDEVVLDFGHWLLSTDDFRNGQYDLKRK